MKLFSSILLFTTLFSIVGGILGAHIYNTYISDKVLGATTNTPTPKATPGKMQLIDFEEISLTLPYGFDVSVVEEEDQRTLHVTNQNKSVEFTTREITTQEIEKEIECTAEDNCVTKVLGGNTFSITKDDQVIAQTAKENTLLTTKYNVSTTTFAEKILSSLSW